jgi:hypothetical protein
MSRAAELIDETLVAQERLSADRDSRLKVRVGTVTTFVGRHSPAHSRVAAGLQIDFR